MLRLAFFFAVGCVAGSCCLALAHRAAMGEQEVALRGGRASYLACSALCGAGVLLSAACWSGFRLALAVAAWTFALFHALTDLLCGYIFDAPVVVSICCATVSRLIWQESDAIFAATVGAAAGWAPLACVVVLTRGGIGWGDALMMAGVGALLGWKLALLSVYLGIMVGGFGGLILLLARRVRLNDPLPMAPFLALGVLGALVLGKCWVARLGGVFF